MSAETKEQAGAGLSLRVGGLVCAIQTNHPELSTVLREHYADFICEAAPDFVVEVSLVGGRMAWTPRVSLDFSGRRVRLSSTGCEGVIDLASKRGELRLDRERAAEDVDYFLRVVYAMLAFEAGGWMAHAAGVVRRGRAHLFFGHSGSGKTTVSRLSQGQLVLNDDLVLILPVDEGWQVHGTPFWNPTQVRPGPGSAPLGGIYFLVQDKCVFLEPTTPGLALAELVSNAPVIPEDSRRNTELLARCASLLRDAAVYRLHFLPDDSFWAAIDAGEAEAGV
ncbi:MAG: hypothetical protein PHS96_07300 [Anaerolineales bacterium]|nr:hypothetical protein [Anaerolineales bacterium]